MKASLKHLYLFMYVFSFFPLAMDYAAIFLREWWTIKIIKIEKNIEFSFFIFFCSMINSDQYATHIVPYAEVL